ncbi:MAG: helix-turn-helix domain-containing protein [Planctomycetia bacterium]|nr:helix-turn-helix domain-containing protein [Planctomycetia bacterium]
MPENAGPDQRTFKERFGTRLRLLRKRAGVPQQVMERSLRISNATTSTWETGKAFPNAEKLPHLAAILGLEHVRDLFSEEIPSSQRKAVISRPDMKSYTRQFGAHMRSLRKQAGVTQQEVADVIGVTKAAVSAWEKGLMFPDVRRIPILASVLNVPIRDLFPEADPPPELQRKAVTLPTPVRPLPTGSYKVRFGACLKKLRKRAGIPQRVIEDALGVSVSTISTWESGRTFPDAEKLPLLATTLRVKQVGDLFPD